MVHYSIQFGCYQHRYEFWRIYGALVNFICYQHKCECMEGFVVQYGCYQHEPHSYYYTIAKPWTIMPSREFNALWLLISLYRSGDFLMHCHSGDFHVIRMKYKSANNSIIISSQAIIRDQPVFAVHVHYLASTIKPHWSEKVRSIWSGFCGSYL